MYTMQGKTRPTWHVRFPHQSTYAWRALPVGGPRTWKPFTSHRQGRTNTTAPEKKCSWLHLSAWLSGPWDPSQFLSQYNHWRSRLKPSTYGRSTTRPTRSMSPACDRYVQFLLTGTNPSVFNRHRWGLPHRKSWNTHSTLPALPSKCSTDPPKWPRPVSIFIHINIQG
jgi:hypothetical protein